MSEAMAILASTRRSTVLVTQQAAGDWETRPVLPGEDVRCLVVDPHDANIIYAGTQGNGVFRSEDSGRTWSPAGLAGVVVKSLAVSPRERGVVYAGTRPALVFRSGDGGNSWNELTGFRHIRGRWMWWSPAESPWKAYVSSLAVSPTDPDRLLAGVEFGAVVLSRDGGKTWTPHRSGALRDCHHLEFHPSHGDWAYEAGGTGGGASVSRDGGETWKKTKDGLAVNYGVSCAADAERPEIWYVSVAPGPGKAYGDPARAYLYRASGGAAWQAIGWEPHPMRHMPLVLVTDLASPGHLYAGTTAGYIWHSPDHGDSWKRLPITLDGSVHSLVLSADPNGRR